MPRKGENIYKRKDGRWEGLYIKGYKTDGKALYGYIYGYTYKETKEKMRNIVTEKRLIPEHANTVSSFEGLAAKWLYSQKSRVKSSTYSKYNNILQLYILPCIGTIHVDKISYEDIERLCDNMLDHGGKDRKGLSPKTVADTVSVVKNIVRFGLQNVYYHSLDMHLIRVRQPAHELRILSVSEQIRLYTHLITNLSPPNLGILICMMTGLRIGEVCALRWEDISFEDHTIHVQGTM